MGLDWGDYDGQEREWGRDWGDYDGQQREWGEIEVIMMDKRGNGARLGRL